MNQPPVFISCVSPEFRQTRSHVADILTRLGYTPVIQEIFGTEPGDLRQVLRDKIDACEGLIQIVGQGYGAEPPTMDADYGRVSYTQFEFLYAREKKKKTWLIFAGDACTRDRPLERLDLPNNPALFDPVAYQAERCALQLTYRDKRRNDGHVYYDVINDADLELKVERLRDELAELRRAFEAFQKELLAGQKELLARSAITTEKIRAHLLESAEGTYQTDLAEAEKAKGWEERERLRQAAERAHVGRLSRIDELAASFAEMEGTGRSTQIFDEMTRILAEEGVDQALAYAAYQRTGILEKVKARAAAAREKNRADLLPLLKSAQLQADRSQPAEAARLFADILALEPDWPDALDAQFWFQITQAERAFYHATLAEASGHLYAAETTVQRLLKAEPDAPRSQRNLSVSYENVGAVQSAQGDLTGALKSYRDSLGIAEKLAKQDPGNALWQRDLSVSYENVGAVQSAQGDLVGTLKSYRDSLGIREKLAKQDPGNAGWQRDLSVSYNKVGDVQRAQGDLAGALKRYRDSLGIAEKLAKQDPGNTVCQRDLSVSYDNVGDVQNAQGDLTGALKSYRDSLEIREKLAKQDPGNTGWQSDLSISYEKVGDVQSVQGDLTGALKSYRDSLGIAEKFAKQDPGNAGWQRDLSVSYDRVGDVQSAQGDLAGALKSYRDSLGIREKLAKQDPGNAGWQRDLSVSYNKVGAVQSAQGDLAGALKSYRDSLGIAEKLAKQDPGNAGWQRDLSVCYDSVGAVQSAQGDLAGALKSYRDSLGIAEKLAKQDPGNAGWQRDLSISYENVGAVQRAQGDLAGALKSYRDSLGIREKLAKQDPGNAGWQRDLSISYENVGAAQSAQGDLAGALKSYRDSLGIAEKLAKLDPGNADWQNHAAWSRYCVAKVLIQIKDGDRNEARRLVIEGIDIMTRLEHQRALDTNAQDTLNKLNEIAPALTSPSRR